MLGKTLMRMEARVLGLIITRNLYFSKHCGLLALKANCSIYNIFRVLKSYIPEVYVCNYKIYVRPS